MLTSEIGKLIHLVEDDNIYGLYIVAVSRFYFSCVRFASLYMLIYVEVGRLCVGGAYARVRVGGLPCSAQYAGRILDWHERVNSFINRQCQS